MLDYSQNCPKAVFKVDIHKRTTHTTQADQQRYKYFLSKTAVVILQQNLLYLKRPQFKTLISKI